MASPPIARSRLSVSDPVFRFRKAVDRAAVIGMAACTLLMVSVLFIILGYITYRGASSIDWSFITALPKPVGESGGGIANAIVGSVIVVGMAAAIAMPIGIGSAIFLSEFQSTWIGAPVRVLGDIMTGVPSIVVGLVAYALVVQPLGGFSGFSGSVAYSIIMVPIVLISAREALRLVPNHVREAALALGVPRWRVILRVVLPTARVTLLTGVVLAVARALGETAPMLFTSFGSPFWNVDPGKPMATVPLVIYRYAVGPYDDWHRLAWAAAFVLGVVVLIASILTRLVLRGRYHG